VFNEGLKDEADVKRVFEEKYSRNLDLKNISKYNCSDINGNCVIAINNGLIE
jgi:hypothetical protein